jgi:hypothetical protein
VKEAMKIKDLFEEWKLTGLRINAPFMEMEWKPSDPDKAARPGSVCRTAHTHHHATAAG